MITITDAADDYNLLSIQELRAAVGVTGISDDAALTTMGEQISAAIARACGVAAAGSTPPTLREESIAETFRLSSCRASLSLARRPVVSVASVVEDGTTLDAEDYELDGGRLLRLESDVERDWPAAKIVVTYTAGWATVPSDLKLAASKMAALVWSQASRDPLAKRERVRQDDVEEVETDYWVGPLNASAIPADVADMLGPYNRFYLVG